MEIFSLVGCASFGFAQVEFFLFHFLQKKKTNFTLVGSGHLPLLKLYVDASRF
jgi:hypothetical protein